MSTGQLPSNERSPPPRAAGAARPTPGLDEVAKPIAVDIPPELRPVIARIGRTEDICFSPDDSRLAIADFLSGRIFVFSLVFDRTVSPPRIALAGYFSIASPGRGYPHGVAFLGNDHFLVCYRQGGLVVFAVPKAGSPSEQTVPPVAEITDKGLLAAVKSPGSAAVYEIAPGRFRILVCNSNWHVVTSHDVTIAGSVGVTNGSVLIEQDLRIPDGVAISPDRQWIAVSNHAGGSALVYRNGPGLRRTTPPAAVLGGNVCPHGIHFSPDGKHILVADAASQYLHVFDSRNGEWRSADEPTRSVRLIDDRTFYAGRYDARDGGLKGLDIDGHGTVLATTFKGGALNLYDFGALLARADAVDRDEMNDLELVRDISVRQTKAAVLSQKWTYTYRIGRAVPRKARSLARRLVDRVSRVSPLPALAERNRTSTDTLLDSGGPVLCMTTYRPRLDLAFYAIETIGLGSMRPSRFVLWIDEKEIDAIPNTLRRMESRGLEIRPSDNYGPHKKYYPYVAGETRFERPLVTADDDALYPRDWLRGLVEANSKDPNAIHGHRAHRIGLLHGRLLPYNMWEPCLSMAPSHLNLLTGVSGAIYPGAFLDFLKQQGTGFELACAHTDDVWLKINALRAGFRVAQVADRPMIFPDIEGSQLERLSDENLHGGNQLALMSTLTPEDFTTLTRALAAEAAY